MILDARNENPGYGRPFTAKAAVLRFLDGIPVGGCDTVEGFIAADGSDVPWARFSMYTSAYAEGRKFVTRADPITKGYPYTVWRRL